MGKFVGVDSIRSVKVVRLTLIESKCANRRIDELTVAPSPPPPQARHCIGVRPGSYYLFIFPRFLPLRDGGGGGVLDIFRAVNVAIVIFYCLTTIPILSPPPPPTPCPDAPVRAARSPNSSRNLIPNQTHNRRRAVRPSSKCDYAHPETNFFLKLFPEPPHVSNAIHYIQGSDPAALMCKLLAYTL